MGKIPALELDSLTLPSGSLIHQRNCELETLRGKNSYNRVGPPSGRNPNSGVGPPSRRNPSSRVGPLSWENSRTLSGENLTAEEWCAHKYAMVQLKLNVRCSIIRANERCKLNKLGWQGYVHLTSNRTKLVRRGDNQNKKTLVYIPYVSCSYRLNIHNYAILGWITRKHSQRCSDNTWAIVSLQYVWCLHPVITRN